MCFGNAELLEAGQQKLAVPNKMASRTPLQPITAKRCSGDFVWLKRYSCCLLKSIHSAETELDTDERASRHQLCLQLLSFLASLMNQHSCFGQGLFHAASDSEKPVKAKGRDMNSSRGQVGLARS